ncbi:hypothetical protein PGTUg99_037614 [Puccinia graminis f. sp. tritici]|uniref:Uncharacterized protein n=1 Tax=Puccinia graminis f. sp. tritici TaxID=56615 RepID=A0A5B0SMW3_PUCGR|nr:hypothetical protein PGTUg99_037614 [Puccinia graminis f. sp. tritici]
MPTVEHIKQRTLQQTSIHHRPGVKFSVSVLVESTRTEILNFTHCPAVNPASRHTKYLSRVRRLRATDMFRLAQGKPSDPLTFGAQCMASWRGSRSSPRP